MESFPAHAFSRFNRFPVMWTGKTNGHNAAVILCCLAAFLLLTPPLTAGPLFQKAQVFRSGGVTANAVAVGDVNGDGKPDLVVVDDCSFSNCDGQVAILLGNGDGTFQPATPIDTRHAFADSLAVADLNGDGKLDIAVATGGSCPPNNCGFISVMLGNGDGTFAAPQSYFPGGSSPQKVLAADVNGDGIPDLLVANLSMDPALTLNGEIGVLLGNGDGTFQAAQVFDSHGFGPSMTVADVNHDGKTDLLVVHELISGVTEVAVFLGNGDGTFQAPQSVGTGRRDPTAITAADINGDGNLDLLITHVCGRNPCNSAIVVLLGNGSGGFQAAPTVYSGAQRANAILAADVNADKKPDLIVANKCFTYIDCSSGSASVLLGLAGVQTMTTLASDLNPSIYGQTINFTASVTTTGPFAPTGKVNFVAQGNSIGTALLNANGIAILAKRNLNATSYPLTAVYLGDTANASSTSAIPNQVVKQTTSAAAMTSSLNPSAVGQAVTFVVTMTSPTVVPSGPVTFTAGKTVLGTAQIRSNGKASLSISSLPAGATKIMVTYLGDSNIAKSSASLTQVVQ